MAFKKKKISKTEEEQLYVLEILVDYLDLGKNINAHVCDLIIRISFIDLTPIDIIIKEFIKENDRSKNKENRFSDKHITYESSSCLFTRTPSDLIRSMKSVPLSIEVYRITDGNDRNPQDEILLCAATAFLPEHICDQVNVSKDMMDEPAKSLKKTYTLTDNEGNPCGSISISMGLSCLGNSTDHFPLYKQSFMSGKVADQKFHPIELCGENPKDKTNKIKGNNMLNKISDPLYSKLCDSMYTTDYTNAASILTKPKSSPRISMDEPGFDKLTNAEKLNDRKYRDLIYETYPDEPTCSCPPTNRSTHILMCRSGCTRSCCMSLRNPNILKNDKQYSISSYDIYNTHMETDDMEQDANCYDTMRMRGGGDRKDLYLNEEMLWDNNYAWYENDLNLNKRLRGGNEYGNVSSEATTEVIYKKYKETNTNMLHKSHPKTMNEPGCNCSGKDWSCKKGSCKCIEKPCVGVDCLIRAFKDAQEFVDSLGKVPGLLGLGLMDPSESPYFGRDIDKDYAIHESPSERKRGYPAVQQTIMPALQCTAPCNTQISKLAIGSTPITYPTFPRTVPGQVGVVREAIPVLPKTLSTPIVGKLKRKEERKEEKFEKQKELEITTPVLLDGCMGPCGEPKCKSRRKAPDDDHHTVSHETVEQVEQEKSMIYTKPPSTAISKTVGKLSERGRPKGNPGPAGDRDIGRNPIKISKRVMRYVYSIGDIYPGIHYGHKNCVDPRFRIPANMGWLWNVRATEGKLKPRLGWKPGAIGRYLNKLLKEAKAGSLQEDSRARSVPSRTRRGKVHKTMSYASVKKAQAKKEDEEEVEPPPIIHIHRKKGVYYLTIYPIKRGTNVPEELTPPVQFKIVKNRDDSSIASSSVASDVEIEFSPPAAADRYRRKPDVVHVDTQVRQQEILDAFKSAISKKKEKKEKKQKKEKKKKR